MYQQALYIFDNETMKGIVVTFILEANMQQYHQGFAIISLFRDAAVAIKTHTSQIKHITVYVALKFVSVFPATNCFWLFAYVHLFRDQKNCIYE